MPDIPCWSSYSIHSESSKCCRSWLPKKRRNLLHSFSLHETFMFLSTMDYLNASRTMPNLLDVRWALLPAASSCWPWKQMIRCERHKKSGLPYIWRLWRDMWRYLGQVSQVEEEGKKRVRNTMSDNACRSELNYVQWYVMACLFRCLVPCDLVFAKDFMFDWYLIEFLIIRLGNSSHVKFNGSFISETQTSHRLMCMRDSWGLPGLPLGLSWSSLPGNTWNTRDLLCIYNIYRRKLIGSGWGASSDSRWTPWLFFMFKKGAWDRSCVPRKQAVKVLGTHCSTEAEGWTGMNKQRRS